MCRWCVLLLIAIAAAGGLYFVKARPAFRAFGAVEVETVQPSVQSGSGPNAGTPDPDRFGISGGAAASRWCRRKFRAASRSCGWKKAVS